MAVPIFQYTKVKGLLRITRSYNLLIILLTQYLVYIFLLGKGQLNMQYILHPGFFVLSISTICIAAAGYIINDYHDVKIDMINKPGRVVVGSVINRRIALLFYFILTFIGITLGFLLSWKIGLINIFSAGMLWIYSIRFKKSAFWGNFSIAILTALSILIIYVWHSGEPILAVLVYAWFAFIITLIREIIKDMEDMRGDKLYGCKTLPILWGIAGTARFLYFLNGAMMLTLLLAFFYTEENVLRLFASIVFIQMVFLTYFLSKADTIKKFRRLGRFCKMIMLTGILAILFF